MRETPSPERWSALHTLALGVTFAFWILHFVHLQADFPNNSPWMDYSKYTDEGWYGNAAIRSSLWGHWFFAGDFNPAVALPVWPLLLSVVFHLAGVSAIAARVLALCVFGGNLALSYALVRAARGSRNIALAGVLLLAASSYFWAFSRLAILEPLLSFWMLLAWLLALRLSRYRDGRQTASLVAIGFLSCLSVLTKTTAIFLLPATAVLICAAYGWKPARALRSLAIAFVSGMLPWIAYYAAVVHAGYARDFHYLFAANQWDRPKGLHDKLLAFWWAAHGLLWIGPTLVVISLLLLLLAVVLVPAFRRQPLLPASVLAVAGYVFFIGWHNSPQPRYYMVLAYPVLLLTLLAVQGLLRERRFLGVAAAAAVALAGVWGGWQSVWYVAHPEYSLLSAAKGITGYIRSHPEGRNPMLLSISGDEISLITHLPAICDDFGSDDLETRIEHYRPGWYAAWNDLDPGTLEDIHNAGFKLEPVQHWHAFDDDDRDDLVLYRILPVKAKR